MSKITMDGEYACRCAPTERVRVLCTDRPGDFPVVSMRANGDLTPHLEDGRYAFGGDTLDLIPLQRPRAKIRGWFNVGPRKAVGPYATRSEAEERCDCYRIACVWLAETDPPEGQE